MTFISTANPWAFVFGLLGNLVSFGVYLAPLPTFIRVIRKKSTEGFQSFPYIVALFSAMLWIYYAWVKQNAPLLITINSVGCVIEVVYISIFVTYAPSKARSLTVKMVAGINFGLFGAILVLTQFLTKGENRIRALGWICVALSASVFGAPLSIMKLVIRTKSVEFMPFWLSFSLLLSAFSWLFYGIFLKDMYIAAPNTLGFAFGVAQMILYAIYRKNKGPVKQVDDGDIKLPETINDNIVKAASDKPSNPPPALPVQTQTQPGQTVTNPPPVQPQTVVNVGGCVTERAVPDRAVQPTQCAV